MCGTWHALNFLVFFTLSFTNDSAKNFLMPVTSLFCNWDSGAPEQAKGLVGNIVFLRWCSYFALLSAIAHFTVLYNFDTYEADLKRGKNRFRWYEYSLSGSLILTLLFQLWGNLDWVQLSGCFVGQMATMFFGDMHESLNAGAKKGEVNWISFKYGMVVGTLPWFIMFYEIYRNPNLDQIPWFVWVFVAEYFICFNLFPYT